ncbi:MAG: DUF1641 domain-containing protein [Bacillales bacterium]
MSTKTNMLQLTPELQEELTETLPVFVRFLHGLKMAGDAMTEETISHLTVKLEKAANLLAIIDDDRLPRLLTALLENGDALVSLLEKAAVLHENGTLDKLIELAEALGSVTDALTEETVQQMTAKALPLVEIGDKILSSKAVKKAPQLIDAVNKTIADMENQKPQPLSVFGLLGLLKKKEVQRALQFTVALLGNLSEPQTK